MKSKQEVLTAFTDLFGRSTNAMLREWIKTHIGDVWDAAYRNGYEQGIEAGKLLGMEDVKNKLDVIDEIKQGEFNRGFKAGQCAEEIEQLKKDEYHRGWEAGREQGIMDESESYGDSMQAAYDAGLNDVWKAAQRFSGLPYEGGLTEEEISAVFGESVPACEIYSRFSAREALLKLKEYDTRKIIARKRENQRLSVGDCVYDCSGNLCVITQIGTAVHVMYPNGKTHKWHKSASFKRTGRSVEVDVLKQQMEQAATT